MVHTCRASLCLAAVLLTACAQEEDTAPPAPRGPTLLSAIDRVELGTTNSGAMLVVYATHQGRECLTPVLEGPAIVGDTATFTARTVCNFADARRSYTLAALLEDDTFGDVTTFVVEGQSGPVSVSRE
ncbi:MAG: hypothetical protein AAFQ51_05715 [Pseudomonadota bacterium]